MGNGEDCSVASSFFLHSQRSTLGSDLHGSNMSLLSLYDRCYLDFMASQYRGPCTARRTACNGHRDTLTRTTHSPRRARSTRRTALTPEPPHAPRHSRGICHKLHPQVYINCNMMMNIICWFIYSFLHGINDRRFYPHQSLCLCFRHHGSLAHPFFFLL